MATTTIEDQLPEVVLIEDILSRLPVKSLLRFKSVCKSWYALITNPVFVKTHLNRSLESNSNLSIIVKEYGSSCFHSVDLDVCQQKAKVKVNCQKLYSPDNINTTRLLGSCNGLICCICNDTDDIFIWNPSTRSHLKLPITPIIITSFREVRFNTYGFGYDPNTDDYKLVRVVQFYNSDEFGDDEDSCHSEVNLYSIRANSWRRIGDMPFPLWYYTNSIGVLANSALHWVAKQGSGFASCFIASFDLKDEEFRKVSLPEEVSRSLYEHINFFRMSVEVLGGQLCVLCDFFNARVDVWVLCDSWVKQFSIEKPSGLTSFTSYLKPLCHSKNGDIIFHKDSKALFSYYPRRGKVRKNSRICGVPELFQTEICVGSLVVLNVKDGTKQADRKEENRKRKRQNHRHINNHDVEEGSAKFLDSLDLQKATRSGRKY